MGFTVTYYSNFISTYQSIESKASFLADKLKMSVHEIDDDSYILYKGTYNGTGLKVYVGTINNNSNVAGAVLATSENTHSGGGFAFSDLPNSPYCYSWDGNSNNGDIGIIVLSSYPSFNNAPSHLFYWTKEQHEDGTTGYLYGFSASTAYAYVINDYGVCLPLLMSNTAYWYDSATPQDVIIAPITVGDIRSSRIYLPFKFFSDARISYYEDDEGEKYITTKAYNGSNFKYIIKLT